VDVSILVRRGKKKYTGGRG
jgi:hypothetical protein